MKFSDSERETIERLNIRILKPTDDDYPKLLREVKGHPKVLFVRGQLKSADDLALAVVGTRRFSSYGREAVEAIVPQLVTAGLTIVSGLARGIDTLAHEAALKAGGRTIAVLGTGIDLIYPAENRDLAQKIIENGALISQFPLGLAATDWSFPERNKVIAGFTLGTLVIEAPEGSGALITAAEAANFSREVFAVPGSIFSPGSFGTHQLIQNGAKLVSNASDILLELNIPEKIKNFEARQILPQSKEEEIILEILKGGPLPIDEIVRKSRLSTATTASTLSLMELKGMVKNMGSFEYRAKT